MQYSGYRYSKLARVRQNCKTHPLSYKLFFVIQRNHFAEHTQPATRPYAGNRPASFSMFARCKLVKVWAGSCHPAKQHGVSIQAETDILKWTAFRNGLFDAHWLEAGLESSAGRGNYGYTATGVKGPQAPIKPKTGGGGLRRCCFMMACARAGETETAAATMGAPQEVTRSGQAGRGYYTLHSISKTSVLISTQ